MLLLLACGCSQNTDGPSASRRMSHSSGNLQQGYKDGVRDAKSSWTETNAAWLWMWMMEQEYEMGYQQGWKAGRSEARLRRLQEQQRSEPGRLDE